MMSRTSSAALVEIEIPEETHPDMCGRIVHPTATIGENVSLGANVKIGAFAVIDAGVQIDDGVDIGAYVYVGPLVRLGAESILHPHVTIRDQVRIGKNVTINCGSVIGSDGFGFASNSGVNHKIPQVGIVEIEDDVWVGSNVTIDRATIGATRIRRGARIDNLAQIGHNVEIGTHTVLRPQVGVAGSTVIGSGSIIGEKTGINGHITVGNGVTVYAFSGIHKGLDDGEIVRGLPAQPVESEKALQRILRELPNLVREFKRLKQKLNGES
jgi:UDP-3-O-[3-hydroxymyristoyl] glucosamine N-acyltransferase